MHSSNISDQELLSQNLRSSMHHGSVQASLHDSVNSTPQGLWSPNTNSGSPVEIDHYEGDHLKNIRYVCTLQLELETPFAIEFCSM
jgi:hypothetical protein